MQVELAQLLRDRQVAHPSRLVSAILEGGDLRIAVTGWPWWSDQADRGRDHNIEIVFIGVADGVIVLPHVGSEDDEFLESFSVVELSKAPWAKAGGSDIYCEAPLPRPFDVYVAVHDFLASSRSFTCPSEYLNYPDSLQLSSFLELVRSGSYLLGRFPTALRDIVCAELHGQGVPFSELVWTHSTEDTRLLVTIGSSHFVCDKAIAIFEV